MNRNLKQRIKEFNKIKFKGNNDTRIIIASLKPSIDYTIVWKDGTKTFQNKDGTVTTAPK
jgi:hypothetical protein